MRTVININLGWSFFKGINDYEALKDASSTSVNVPHTWNGEDGQDGGGDYWRGSCWYVKKLDVPAHKEGDRVYIELKGTNSTGELYINGKFVAKHDGGYSTWRADITDFLGDENEIAVKVDNSYSDIVYPQTADFTFYGGMYRDINVIIVDKNHFTLDHFGGKGIKLTPSVNDKDGVLKIEAWVVGEGTVETVLFDKEGNEVGRGNDEIKVPNVHLWNGRKDPYLYTAKTSLIVDGNAVDEVDVRIGFRTYSIDPKKGFFLNGDSYPLRGVAKHQDRRALGNAVSLENQQEDMRIIDEMGANTIRLSHYQHDDCVYDLCDEYGFVVWAEIPYISRHMLEEGNANLEQQMTELVVQQYHHPSIVVWGISNEITMMQKGVKANMMKEQVVLNDLCHKLDSTRLTTMACFSMCGPFNPISKITDTVSWNLYFGWYFPGLFVNDLWFGFKNLFNRKYCVGLSEYGAEGMTNLHTSHPRRGDSSEEYNSKYHEYMLQFFSTRPYLWATHVWNMFDFGSDGRTHGGDNGVNHKGLVTFDHKTKKDAYYIYKAWWSDEPFVHITSKRYINRCEKVTEVKVYSNQKEVELFVDGVSQGKKTGEHIFKWKVALNGEIEVKAVSGPLADRSVIKYVDKPDQSYVLHVKSNNYSWEKKDKDKE